MKEHIKKLLRKSCLLALFLTTVGMQGLYAQKTVTGTVLDEANQPIPGANVVVKGTNNGVVTDFDGNFSIEASSENVLSISYIGYADQNVTVGNKATITVTMEPDVQQLEDVVVIGYGTVKKSDVTGFCITYRF
ncbi:carboxypeptidase-like regulatory domain-containing protein [Zobellia nedashkovskayae]